jgi:phosphatidylinositol phospholipase C gamma-1
VNPVSAASSSSSNASRNSFEFALEIREIKEIRFGKNSKDFDKWEESKKIDSQKCFVLLYGNEFKLKTFSVVAHSEKECEMWIKGVKYLLNDTINSPYPLQIERWLRKEFYAMENINKA